MIKYDVEMYQSGELTRMTQCWADTDRGAKAYATRWAMRVCKLPLNNRYGWKPLRSADQREVEYHRDFVNCELILKPAA